MSLNGAKRCILIAGCGRLGGALAENLAELGHQVMGLRRQPPDETFGQPDHAMQWVQADLLQPDDLACLKQPVDEVFYILTPGSRSPEAYRAVYMKGVQNLHHRLSELGGSAHWTFVSSTSVYGQQDGSWVDESSETEPASDTARVLLEAEHQLRCTVDSCTIVRLAGLYGPGRSALMRSVQRGDPVQAELPYFTNRVHQDDARQILRFLMEKRLQGHPLDPVYLACDDDPATKREVADWLAVQLGCAVPPNRPVDMGARQNKRCTNQRLKSLGYRFKYPSFRAGYTAMLAKSSATT